MSFSRPAITSPDVRPSNGLPGRAFACGTTWPPLGRVYVTSVSDVLVRLKAKPIRDGIGMLSEADVTSMDWSVRYQPSLAVTNVKKMMCYCAERCTTKRRSRPSRGRFACAVPAENAVTMPFG